MGFMIRCIQYEECKARMYPEDPEAPAIKHGLPPLCDVCGGYQPSYEPRIVQTKTTVIMNKKALQHEGRLRHIEEELQEHFKAHRQPLKKYKTYE